MKVIFDTYKSNETIAVRKFLKNPKLQKYFNRETAAAVISVSKLMKDIEIDKNTPIYYSMGSVEFESYGLKDIEKASKDINDDFAMDLFAKSGISAISPLTQFKVLYNMTLCFICIENSLRGENGASYSKLSGLILSALCAPFFPILIGAGKQYNNGDIETGFALITKDDISSPELLQSNSEAIELFRKWASK